LHEVALSPRSVTTEVLSEACTLEEQELPAEAEGAAGAWVADGPVKVQPLELEQAPLLLSSPRVLTARLPASGA